MDMTDRWADKQKTKKQKQNQIGGRSRGAQQARPPKIGSTVIFL